MRMETIIKPLTFMITLSMEHRSSNFSKIYRSKIYIYILYLLKGKLPQEVKKKKNFFEKFDNNQQYH
jgi:hypothetical protein